jgi:hypothetical protein
VTKLLEQAVDAVRALPPEMQDDLARLLLQLAGDEQSTVIVTAAEAESLEESLEQASRREFATDEQVTSVWAKHDL